MDLKESLVWKSMSDEFFGQEVDIIFGLKYYDEVIQGQRSNVDACVMDKTGKIHEESMTLLKLDVVLKN